MLQRDSIANTVFVSLALCVVCSLLVSGAAVGLKDRQEANKKLDRQKNILEATGLAMSETGQPSSKLSREKVDELFKRIESKLVDLKTGEYVDRDPVTDRDSSTYDERKAARETATNFTMESPKFDTGISSREKIARVYLVRDKSNTKLEQIVLPVYGKGLWSTLYGFLAVDKDLNTIRGLTFYEHAETPGLGGEVDNPEWKAKWKGKVIYNPQGEPSLGVSKGPSPPGNQHMVDGLSGATITSNGVTWLLRSWVSDDGFGPFFEKLAEQSKEHSKTSELKTTTQVKASNG